MSTPAELAATVRECIAVADWGPTGLQVSALAALAELERQATDAVFHSEVADAFCFERDEAKARTQQLEGALRKIQEWDCLNPPDPKLCADHPWLKRHVDAVLAAGGPTKDTAA